MRSSPILGLTLAHGAHDASRADLFGHHLALRCDGGCILETVCMAVQGSWQTSHTHSSGIGDRSKHILDIAHRPHPSSSSFASSGLGGSLTSDLLADARARPSPFSSADDRVG